MNARENTWTSTSGEVLTEADAARLAEEFERDDAALTTADVTFPRRAGRPSRASVVVPPAQSPLALWSKARLAADFGWQVLVQQVGIKRSKSFWRLVMTRRVDGGSVVLDVRWDTGSAVHSSATWSLNGGPKHDVELADISTAITETDARWEP